MKIRKLKDLVIYRDERYYYHDVEGGQRYVAGSVLVVE